jgi:predicted dehydrogenase
MNRTAATRREFLKTTAVSAATAAAVPYFFTHRPLSAADEKASGSGDRLRLGCIGTGSRWNAVGPNAMKFSDCLAVCDVDAGHAKNAAARVEKIQGKAPEVHEDYRRVLDNKDIDVVTIVTPDHWHSKIAVEALQAGKDVYCEKPLTLTIEEGKQIRKVLDETGRVFQVGTQQRSEMGRRFLQAVAMIRDGRIGEVREVHVAIGGSPTSGPIPVVDVPGELNWEKWLGQAPLVDYRYKPGGRWGKTRCHYEFRWWYEYSGGKMTDWGAHHVDIAQWAIGQVGEGQGCTLVEPLAAEHPMPYDNGWPTLDDRYNAATSFHVRVRFPGDVVMNIRHSCQDDLGFGNGIMFVGTEGRFLVNRGKIVGAPVDALKDDPLPENWLQDVYNGKTPAAGNAHMQNFFECVKSREQPISDVHSHHRALTTCHLANIAIRLDRKLEWDPKTEQIVGDDEANGWQRREQREGYEIDVKV